MTEEAKIVLKLSNYNPTSAITKAAEELYKRIIAAQEQMAKDNIEANTIVLNGNKFGYLKRPGYTPTLFGMKVETSNMPEEYDFMLMDKLEYFVFRSNADRIRNMTDEELAKFISGKARTFGEEYEGYMSALDWLRQEAED